VRKRITALATLAVIAVLGAASVALVLSQRRLLTRQLDQSMIALVDDVTAQISEGRLPTTITRLGEDDTMAQVVVGRTVVAASANIAGKPPVAPPPRSRQAIRTVTGLPHDDAAFRLVSRRLDQPEGQVVIHVAGILEDVDDSTTVLATSLSLAIPVVATLLAALIWLLVGRTLRPVEAIRAEVADIGGSDLYRRVPVPPGDDEIGRLARTMNTMLERVDDASQRQARFVADASHELRSPLTRIRSELEVDLAHTERADLAATHRSILEETVGLQHLVDDLLQLARTDAVTSPGPAGDRVDLDDIVLALARRLRADGRVVVDITGVSPVQMVGHSAQLTRAVGNLAENAVRHATSTVTLTLGELDHRAVLTVDDDGPGIPPEDRKRIFDRFTRLDQARTTTAGGAGLGLAIAREIVERHSGTLVVDHQHQPGARFVLTLPLSPEDLSS